MTPRPEDGWATERFDRRRLLRYAAGTAVAASLASLYGCSADSSPQPSKPSTTTTGKRRKPNILVIYADDQRYDTLRFMPTMQRLIKSDATTFRQARQSTSQCSPSRASFLLGQFATGPDGHGMQSNFGRLSPAQANGSLASWLAGAGYYCGLAGKYFNAFETKPPAGWSWWRALVQGKDQKADDNDEPAQDAHGYGVFDGKHVLRSSLHQASWQTGAVQKFIDTAPEPWFLWDCPTSPHVPSQPTPRNAAAKTDDRWPVVGNDANGKPSWMRKLAEPNALDVFSARDQISAMLREVLDLDDHVAAIFDKLRDLGVDDHTTVLYASDNATALLDYRLPLFAKNLPYDVSTHVPVVCIGSGFPAGTNVDVPVSAAVDLTATCLALAGAEATVAQHGTSLTTLAADPERYAERVTWGSCLHEDHQRFDIPTNDWVVADQGDGLRKLIRYQGAKGRDQYEAYDLDTDPNELVNWAYDKSRRVERDKLEAALDAELK